MKGLRKKMITGVAAAGLAAALMASGCSTTVESQPAAAKAVESGGSAAQRSDGISRR